MVCGDDESSLPRPLRGLFSEEECKVALYPGSSHVVRLVAGMRDGEHVRGE